MTVSEQLAEAGVRPYIYYRWRRQGYDHATCIEKAKEAKRAPLRVGNILDHTSVGAAQLLKLWRR